MNDNPAASTARSFASEIIPASATIVTSCGRWASRNARIVGSIVAVSAWLTGRVSCAAARPWW
jgi:hypothetical protein